MCASCHRRPTFLPARPNDVDAAIMSFRLGPARTKTMWMPRSRR
jgi:hypothetical protein